MISAGPLSSDKLQQLETGDKVPVGIANMDALVVYLILQSELIFTAIWCLECENIIKIVATTIHNVDLYTLCGLSFHSVFMSGI